MTRWWRQSPCWWRLEARYKCSKSNAHAYILHVRQGALQDFMTIRITPFEPRHHAQILALSHKAWSPVFSAMRQVVQPYVYENFYPNGWDVRQTADIEAFLRDEGEQVGQLARGILSWVG